MLFAAREHELRPEEAEGVPTLTVDGLDDDAAAALLDSATSNAAPAVRSRLLLHTRGNPLALVELPAALSEALAESAGVDADQPDPEDKINDALQRRMDARKMLNNASYFAFTATPKNKTLEMFGEPVLPSIQSYVVLGLSSNQGVKMGDEFLIYQPQSKPDEGELADPEIPISRVQVVRSTQYGVTAVVLGQEQPAIKEGMSARVIARMP